MLKSRKLLFALWSRALPLRHQNTAYYLDGVD